MNSCEVLAREGGVRSSRPFSQRIKAAAVRSSIFATEHGMGTTRTFSHCGRPLPALSDSVGLIAIVGTKRIHLMLQNNAAVPPP